MCRTRGDFPHDFKGDLDMRMDQEASVSAKEYLNTYEAAKLHNNLRESTVRIKNAKTLANANCCQSGRKAFWNDGSYLYCFSKRYVQRGKILRYYAQVLSSICASNQRWDPMPWRRYGMNFLEVLKPEEGDLGSMSYHSLRRSISQGIWWLKEVSRWVDEVEGFSMEKSYSAFWALTLRSRWLLTRRKWKRNPRAQKWRNSEWAKTETEIWVKIHSERN